MTFEKFHWTSPRGVQITLPHMDDIPTGMIRKYRRLDGGDALFSILEEIADEATLALVDGLSRGEFAAMAEAWEKAESSVSVGESSGSSTSSTPIGEPSSTTSAPASPASLTV